MPFCGNDYLSKHVSLWKGGHSHPGGQRDIRAVERDTTSALSTSVRETSSVEALPAIPGLYTPTYAIKLALMYVLLSCAQSQVLQWLINLTRRPLPLGKCLDSRPPIDAVLMHEIKISDTNTASTKTWIHIWVGDLVTDGRSWPTSWAERIEMPKSPLNTHWAEVLWGVPLEFWK